jgi:hypothetical protein
MLLLEHRVAAAFDGGSACWHSLQVCVPSEHQLEKGWDEDDVGAIIAGTIPFTLGFNVHHPGILQLPRADVELQS